MQCPRCRHETLATVKFCGECGARLATTCPTCQSVNPPGAAFCGDCGRSLAAYATPEGLTSPEAYTPRHLAEKILTSRSALEGERKHVTVLFADLKDSMLLLGDRDPEDARRLLDPLLMHMIDAVHDYEGTVNQVMGDGVMALFGAPVAHEDHAVRACYAALRMQESATSYADEVERTEGVRPLIRVGLNSGDVVVRSIGSDLHMDYTAVGHTTHLAARMEQLAPPGSILATPETLRLAEGRVVARALGERAVKGLAAPVEAHEVVGAAVAHSRFAVAANRGLSPFVGRAFEMRELCAVVGRAADHGQVVALVGEPGVGKSRLCWELVHADALRGWLVLEAESVSYGRATAYLPVVSLITSYFAIQPGDGAPVVREKVSSRLAALDPELASSETALLWLLDVPVDDPQWARLDPGQRRRRTLDAVKRVLLRESRRQPVALIVQDLHWIDAETQALLDGLVESLPGARMILILSYRPEYQHGWAGRSYYHQLRVDPLPPMGAAALLGPLLGAGADLEPLQRALIARTEGNPLYLEECVRTLVETRALVGSPGDYRLARPEQIVAIPATVQAILAARIDRLSPEDKRLLQAASVIGKEVPFLLLRAIADLAETDLRRGLERLQAAEFLYEAQLFPDLEYTFKHALTHEVAYRSLLSDRRRALHARLVEAIEAQHGDRLAEHLDRLAHHAFHGDRWDKAVDYLRQAAARAAIRSANRQAAHDLERALSALRRLPDSPERAAQEIDIRFDIRGPLFVLGDFGAVSGHLEEAERLARTLGDERRLGWASIYMGYYLWLTGRWTGPGTFAEEARAIAERLGDFHMQVAAGTHLAIGWIWAGDYRRAEDLLRGLLASLAGQPRRERFGLQEFPAIGCRWYLAWCLAERGQFAEAVALGADAIRVAEEIGFQQSVTLAYWGVAHVHVLRGDLAEAERLLDRALARCREWDLPVMVPPVEGALGYVYVLSGRVAEGRPMLERALAAYHAMSAGWIVPLGTLYLAEALARERRLAEADALAEKGARLCGERRYRGLEAQTLHVHAQIAAARGAAAADDAERLYGEALAIADELGMRPLVAHCRLGLGRLHRVAGDATRAAEHLGAAARLYEEMHMPFWAEQAR